MLRSSARTPGEQFHIAFLELRGAGGAKGQDDIVIALLEGVHILERHVAGGFALAHHHHGQAAAGLIHREVHTDVVALHELYGRFKLLGIHEVLYTARKDGHTQRGVRGNRDSFLQMYAFVSSDDSMSAADLCDFVGSTILDPLSRVDGVGEVSLFGAPYAMRIWLNPSKLLSYSLTPSDVINAVKAQNKQVSLGEVGGKPIRGSLRA